MSAAPANAFESIRSRLDRLVTVRDEANREAIKAVRAVEGRLREALAGDVLRGLSELACEGENRVYGLRLGAVRPWERFPRDGREHLFLSLRGELLWGTSRGEARAVRDGEVRADHMEDFARVVREAIKRHLARIERTSSNYAAMSALAVRISRAIAG